MLKVTSLSFSYPTQPVLQDINFYINQGEFVSVLGKSGCGKTTLVNLLAGYLRYESGQILFNNHQLRQPGRNRIVMNQENDLFDWMTVKQNLEIVSKNKKQNAKYLDMVGLSQQRNFFPKQLSGGMKKRLALARALSIEPGFMILDEPFASLDYYTKAKLHVELDRIFFLTKKSTLLVTHDIDEAIFLSDRIILLGSKPTTVIKTYKLRYSHPRKQRIRKLKSYLTLEENIRNSLFGNDL